MNLPMADVVHATRARLWDRPARPEEAVSRQDIDEMRPADRMLLAMALPVSPSGRIVAAALAYHGWVSWPSLDRLAALTRIRKQHVSRTIAVDLRGVVVKKRRHEARGRQSIQYVFDGYALEEARDTLLRDAHAGNGGWPAMPRLGTAPGTEDAHSGNRTGRGTSEEREMEDQHSGSLDSGSHWEGTDWRGRPTVRVDDVFREPRGPLLRGADA